MSYTGQIAVQLDFTYKTWTNSSWVNVTGEVLSARWANGRRSFAEDHTPQTATVTFCNDSRWLDPTNTQGPYYPLPPRCKLRILTRPDSSQSWRVGFVGRSTSITAEFGADGSANATIEAVDLLGELNVDLRNVPEELLAEQAQEVAWHEWGGPETRLDGLLNELWQGGSPGSTGANELTNGPNITNISNSASADVQNYHSITFPLDPDTYNSANDGLVLIVETYAKELVFKELLCSGTFVLAFAPDWRFPEVHCWLSAANNNPTTALYVNVIWGPAREINGNITNRPPATVQVGTVGDLLDRWSYTILAIGGFQMSLHFVDSTTWAVRSYLVGAVPQLSGDEVSAGTLAGPKTGNWTLTDSAHYSGRWYCRKAILAYGGSDYTQSRNLANKIAANKGMTPRGLNARLQWTFKQSFAPDAWLDSDLPNTLTTAPSLSDVNGLALAQNLVRSARGRMYVAGDGRIKAESRATAISRAATQKAAFTDANTANKLGYRSGSGNPIMDGSRFANRLSLTDGWGKQTAWIQPTANAQNGDMWWSGNVDLINSDQVLSWAASKLEAEAFPVSWVDSIVLKPEMGSNVATQIHQLEVGDMVRVRRHPGGVGSVFDAQHVIEGIEMTFDAETGFTAELFLSPRSVWSQGAFP